MDYVMLMFKMLTGGLNRFSRGHFAKYKCGQMGLPPVLSIGQGTAGKAVLCLHSCQFPNIRNWDVDETRSAVTSH